jgi:hypothetical protein
VARILQLYSDSGVYSDAGSTPATDGQGVQQWNDGSGSANHRTQGTSGSRPTLQTNELNGLPILRFDGVGGGSDTLAGAMSSISQPCTIAIVCKKNATGSAVPWGGGTQCFLYDWGASTAKLNCGTDLTFNVDCTVWNIITVSLNGGSSVVRVNGVETTGNPGTNGPGTNFTVGAWGASGFEYAGDIAAVIVENTALDATGRANLEDELNDKYAIIAGGGDPSTTATLTGPTSGTVNEASTNFTVTLDGDEYTGTITPASDGSGTFSPTSLSWAGTAEAKTFTYTPTSTTGSPHDISISESPDLTTSGSPIAYTVNAGPVTITVDDADLFFSPYNWLLSGSSYAQTNNTGAYLKTKFTGTSCKLNVSIPATSTPSILYSIDGGAWTRADMTSATTQVTLATGLADTTHTLTVIVVFLYHGIDRWSTPTSRLRVTGVVLDGGEDVAAPDLFSGRMLVYADSNGEGFEALGVGTTQANSDASQAFPILLGWAFGCEVGVVAYASQGYAAATGAPAGVPDLEDAWDFYYDGSSRLSGGLLSPEPDYIFCTMGQNDGSGVQAAVEALISAWRAAAPDAKLVFVAPANLNQASAITAGVTASADANAFYVTTGEDFLADESGANAYGNANHLNVRGHALYAATVARLAQEEMGGGGGGSAVFPVIGSAVIRGL